MGLNTAFRRIVSGSSSSMASWINSSQLTSVRSKHTVTRGHVSGYDRPLRQFVSSKGKSAGRNSSGRITIFHRGGGAKRLQREIDLKRSTSSLGVVERIEYDPNRTSRIALVRWIEGEKVSSQMKVNTVENYSPPHKTFDPTLTPIQGQFSFSSLPGMVDQRKLVSSRPMANHVVVGLDNGKTLPISSKATGHRITSAKDVFFNAFSKAKGHGASYSFVSSLGLPRIAVAGARPAFFAPRMREDVKGNERLSLGEIQKWDSDSVVWAHKIKRKAALPWQSLRRQDKLGLIGAAEQNKSKPKIDHQVKEVGKYGINRAPVSYIIATNKMEAGRMVMNCVPPKSSKDDLSRPSQYTNRK